MAATLRVVVVTSVGALKTAYQADGFAGAQQAAEADDVVVVVVARGGGGGDDGGRVGCL